MENKRGGVRVGAGRKTKGNKPRVQFSCTMSLENKEYLQKSASFAGLSVSDFLSEVVEYYRNKG